MTFNYLLYQDILCTHTPIHQFDTNRTVSWTFMRNTTHQWQWKRVPLLLAKGSGALVIKKIRTNKRGNLESVPKLPKRLIFLERMTRKIRRNLKCLCAPEILAPEPIVKLLISEQGTDYRRKRFPKWCNQARWPKLKKDREGRRGRCLPFDFWENDGLETVRYSQAYGATLESALDRYCVDSYPFIQDMKGLDKVTFFTWTSMIHIISRVANFFKPNKLISSSPCLQP